MGTFITIYITSVVISCIMGLIFCYRAERKYEAFTGDGLIYLALLLFVLLIPILNVFILTYYAIFLWERNLVIKRIYRRDIDAIEYDEYIMKRKLNRIK